MQMVWNLSVARSDRYNHVAGEEDTEDDTDDSLFQSFSSCSPRYSKVYLKCDELKEVNNLFICLLMCMGILHMHNFAALWLVVGLVPFLPKVAGLTPPLATM